MIALQPDHSWPEQLPAVAFFDVDGTLIGPSGHYSNRTRNAINALQQRGVATAIASGRPPYAARWLMEELQLLDTGVFFAGACLYEPRSNAYQTVQALAGDPQALLAEAMALGLYCELYQPHHYYWLAGDPAIYEAHSRVLRLAASCNDPDPHEPVIKLLLGSAEPTHLTALESRYPHYQFAYARMASHPNWLFASVVHAEVDRSRVFERLCQHYGITPQQVMAFGDAQSDQAFIENAGLGVAMGDAPFDVRAVADIVTTSAAEDGVARVIEEILKRL